MKIKSFDIFNTLIARDLVSRRQNGLILAVKAQQRFSGKLPAAFAQNLQAIRNEAQPRAHGLTEHAKIR